MAHIGAQWRTLFYEHYNWRTMAQMAPLCAREQNRRPDDDGYCFLLFFSAIFFLFFSFLLFFSLLLLYGILCYLVPVISFYLVLWPLSSLESSWKRQCLTPQNIGSTCLISDRPIYLYIYVHKCIIIHPSVHLCTRHAAAARRPGWSSEPDSPLP